MHRPKYDDWSLPKGKLEPGETHEAAAVREVEEETGWHCAPRRGTARRCATRTGTGRPKQVRYWRMTPERFAGSSRRTTEIDDVRWISLPEAATLLSYDADRHLLDHVRDGQTGHQTRP